MGLASLQTLNFVSAARFRHQMESGKCRFVICVNSPGLEEPGEIDNLHKSKQSPCLRHCWWNLHSISTILAQENTYRLIWHGFLLRTQPVVTMICASWPCERMLRAKSFAEWFKSFNFNRADHHQKIVILAKATELTNIVDFLVIFVAINAPICFHRLPQVTTSIQSFSSETGRGYLFQGKTGIGVGVSHLEYEERACSG